MADLHHGDTERRNAESKKAAYKPQKAVIMEGLGRKENSVGMKTSFLRTDCSGAEAL